MKRAVWAVVIAIPVVGLLWFGFGRNPNATASPLLNKPAPTFVLHSLDGKTLSLAHLRGRPVVLNFWASWCVECKADHAALVQGWETYKKHGVAFVGVSYQDSASGARAWLAKHGAGWPDLQDPNQETAINYGVTGVPETFFVDGKGIVRYHVTGSVSTALLAAQLDRLLRIRA